MPPEAVSPVMARRYGAAISVAVVLLLAGTLAAIGPATGTDTSKVSAGGPPASLVTPLDQTTSAETIELNRELQLVPDEPGTFAATNEYRPPDSLTSLEVTLPEGATVQSSNGFDALEDRTYAWNEETDTPSLHYQLSGNETVPRDGPISAPGSLIFADTGDWALVRQPGIAHSWSWQGQDVQVSLDRTTTARQGVVGDQMVYLGPYEEHVHEAHDQRFRLVVPGPATLEETPSEIFDALGATADRLRVDARDPEVLAIAAPTGNVDWAVRGLQTGESDMWVRDVEPLADPDNVWIHEYVHTRQDYDPASDFRWFTEATATYYAALATFEQDRISFEQFQALLARGERSIHADSVLAEPSSWQRNANYHVGALVSGELDRQLRLATDRERSLQTVFRRVNAASGTVSAAEFRAIVADAAGDDLERVAETLTETTERPGVWDREQHGDAFAIAPARFTFEPTGDRTVTGPYRNRTLTEGDPVVVPGETVSVDVLVSNAGGTTGEYEAPFVVDDVLRETRTGALDPDESTILTVDEPFQAPGTYNLSVGDSTVSVEVREPAPLTIDETRLNRSQLNPGHTVSVTVGLRNDAAYPGERNLTLTSGSELLGTEEVRLDADSHTEVTFETQFADPGEYTLTVGEETDLTVTVESSDPDGDAERDDSSNGTGETDPADGADSDPDGDAERDDSSNGTGETDPADGAETGSGLTVLGALLAIALIVCLRLADDRTR